VVELALSIALLMPVWPPSSLRRLRRRRIL